MLHFAAYEMHFPLVGKKNVSNNDPAFNVSLTYVYPVTDTKLNWHKAGEIHITS